MWWHEGGGNTEGPGILPPPPGNCLWWRHSVNRYRPLIPRGSGLWTTVSCQKCRPHPNLEYMGAKGTRRFMGTKGTQGKILSTLHPYTILKHNLGPTTHPNLKPSPNPDPAPSPHPHPSPNSNQD